MLDVRALPKPVLARQPGPVRHGLARPPPPLPLLNPPPCSQYRVPYTSNLCGLSNQFGSGCNGLQLINPGVDGLAPGQLINVPPCNF